MKINSTSIPLAYALAKQVYEGKLKHSVAVKNLSDSQLMNSNSASDYINNFKLMIVGRKFQRTLNYDSMDYFLRNIYNDYGLGSLSKALLALSQHIDYYEDLQGVTMKKMRQLLGTYKEITGTPHHIENIRDLKDNIETLENFLTSTQADQITNAQKLIKQGTCFLAYSINNEIRFAPSRFL